MNRSRVVPALGRHAWYCLLLIASLGLSGVACAGVGKMQEEPTDRGELVAFEADAAKVLAASKTAMAGMGFEIVEEETVQRGTYVLVGKSSGEGSWGEFMRAIVSEQAPNFTTLRLHNVKRIDMNVTEDLSGMRRKLLMAVHTEMAK